MSGGTSGDMSDVEHPARAAVEHVAEDLAEIAKDAEALRARLERRLDRLAEATGDHVTGWLGRATAAARRLEEALGEVDRRVDELAGRFPRD